LRGEEGVEGSDEALATAAADSPAVAVAMTLAIRTSRRLAVVEDGGAFIRLTPWWGVQALGELSHRGAASPSSVVLKCAKRRTASVELLQRT
jgi:hypothetical protein